MKDGFKGIKHQLDGFNGIKHQLNEGFNGMKYILNKVERDLSILKAK